MLYVCLNAGFTAVFTNLGETGSKGPDSIGSHYKDQDHDRQVKLFSGIQVWTVPRTGEYRIEAIGASGGYGKDSVIKTGGRGARMIGNFILTKDEIIRILVGQKGKRGDSNPKTAGGGGGTFVVRGNNKSLIIAGGGGGVKKMSEQHPGCDASINTTGNAGNNSPLGTGGSNGHGGKTSGQSPSKEEDHSKIYQNLIIETSNSNFKVFLFSEAPLRISKVQLSFPLSF